MRPSNGLPTFLRFARFRAIGISLLLIWSPSPPRNGANRKRLAIPVPASRGRAPSRPATINLTHVFPRPLATTDNAETCDLVLKTRGVVRRPRTTPLRSRVCGISLLAYDQGFMRTLLTVAGT